MATIAPTVLASYEKTAGTVIKNLGKHNMDGYFCATSADAVDLVTSWMHEGDSVTWGGSETFKETGMKAALEEAGCYQMLDRASATTPEEQREMWRDRTTADWFFMSANALTVSGELVNIDGNSDRCSLLLHGPAHVVVLVGMNKMVADVDAGIKRIRTITCPLNAERLHTETPCELTGVCADCHAPKCMCCNVVVTRHSRHEGRIRVVLIGEDLGY
ncbi:lactate utilization protein [Collinsella sp. An2]|uniref:lactate utilization protein n=1 Tax=Collinsella sp. An2 TaxID=1965585 RepID=UPI000B38E2D8|nr:lactate utilization protein [Collinsella sp. An2]OUP06077.1 lactate utilization protein [Collinsella sp. An2]